MPLWTLTVPVLLNSVEIVEVAALLPGGEGALVVDSCGDAGVGATAVARQNAQPAAGGLVVECRPACNRQSPGTRVVAAVQIDLDAGPCRRAGATQLQGPPAIQGEAGDESCAICAIVVPAPLSRPPDNVDRPDTVSVPVPLRRPDDESASRYRSVEGHGAAVESHQSGAGSTAERRRPAAEDGIRHADARGRIQRPRPAAKLDRAGAGVARADIGPAAGQVQRAALNVDGAAVVKGAADRRGCRAAALGEGTQVVHDRSSAGVGAAAVARQNAQSAAGGLVVECRPACDRQNARTRVAIAIQVDRDAGPCRRAGATQLQGPPAIQGEAGDERCTTLCDRRPRAALPSPDNAVDGDQTPSAVPVPLRRPDGGSAW